MAENVSDSYAACPPACAPPAARTGKPIPTELREEEAELRHQIEMDDAQTEQPRAAMDDEYLRAGEADPRVMITTSRDPSSRLVQFAKEMTHIFPNSTRINRGRYASHAPSARGQTRLHTGSRARGRTNCRACGCGGSYTTQDVVDACRKNDVTDLVLVHEHRGEPDGLVISHMPHGPTAFFGLMNVVTRHDIKAKETVSEVCVRYQG